MKPSDRLRALRSMLGQRVDIAWLAAFRAFFGLAMAISMGRFLAYGWIDDLWIKPKFHFKYWGFGWVEPLSATGMYALFWGLGALALCMAAGAFFRLAAALFVVGFAYLQLIDVATYLNHYYLALLLAFLLGISPAHRAYSVDAWRTSGPPRALRGDATTPLAWLVLFRFQVGVVYTFAGLAKAHSDWLVHAQPLRIWLGSRTGMPLIGQLFTVSGAALAMSWGGFLFDTTVPWFLLWRRTRPFAFLAVLGFHAVTRALFPIGMFPVIMILAALTFFPPSWPRPLLRRLSRVKSAANTELPRPPATRPIPTLALALGIAYGVAQVALPLRFLAYGENVRWHEQGMRFSWRVMVREKNGTVTYVVRNPVSGKTWHVAPRSLLTRLQEREMSGQPDLVLQLAHRVRDDFERQGLGPVEVRADALVSLNGRRLAPLVDPTVDLSTVRDGIARAPWILPAPGGPPPHIRPL